MSDYSDDAFEASNSYGFNQAAPAAKAGLGGRKGSSSPFASKAKAPAAQNKADNGYKFTLDADDDDGADGYGEDNYEEDEENFAWYDTEDRDTYFVLTTMGKHCYKKDDQVFHCYGRRSNDYLISNYGFCLANNKYNSLSFRVNIDFGWKQPGTEQGEMQVTKLIRLKENRIRDELLGYVRANLMKQNDHKIKENKDITEKEREDLIKK